VRKAHLTGEQEEVAARDHGRCRGLVADSEIECMTGECDMGMETCMNIFVESDVMD
jgi:hypothetical protein